MALTIRWMGAYGHGSCGLYDSLKFEISRRTTECAAETLDTKSAGPSVQNNTRSHLGLLVDPKCIVRQFRGDVWSVRNDSGKLRPTRKGVGRYNECFIQPKEGWIKGIVIVERYRLHGRSYKFSLSNMRKESRMILEAICREYDLPIYQLRAGRKLVKLGGAEIFKEV